MSLRYILEIKNKTDGETRHIIQLFGRNDLINELHAFAGIKIEEPFLEETPESFEKELNKDSLKELYTVVDNYCKNFAMRGGTFDDLTDPFDVYINFNTFLTLSAFATVFQSAQMFYRLVKYNVITRDSFDINPEYTVTLTYS